MGGVRVVQAALVHKGEDCGTLSGELRGVISGCNELQGSFTEQAASDCNGKHWGPVW